MDLFGILLDLYNNVDLTTDMEKPAITTANLNWLMGVIDALAMVRDELPEKDMPETDSKTI